MGVRESKITLCAEIGGEPDHGSRLRESLRSLVQARRQIDDRRGIDRLLHLHSQRLGGAGYLHRERVLVDVDLDVIDLRKLDFRPILPLGDQALVRHVEGERALRRPFLVQHRSARTVNAVLTKLERDSALMARQTL
jgi:hypothetical protein